MEPRLLTRRESQYVTKRGSAARRSAKKGVAKDRSGSVARHLATRGALLRRRRTRRHARRTNARWLAIDFLRRRASRFSKRVPVLQTMQRR